MTIKEMIKKVNTYNELAKQFGENEKQLYMHRGFSEWVNVTSFKEFKHFIEETYIEEFAKSILNCNEWDFDKPVQIVAYQFGQELKSDPDELYFFVRTAR